MEQFSESRAGRQKILAGFHLTARHARMLLDGCVRDIVLELAGAGPLTESSTIVIATEYGTADVRCGHAGCKAFMATLAKPKPRKKKKR